MQHPRWREGNLSTGFIAEEFPDGFALVVSIAVTEGQEVKAGETLALSRR
jgi:propionyl-CoA carboxylase alpha chain